MPYTAWMAGTGDWMAQRSRVEPNMTTSRKKVNVMVPNDILIYSQIGVYPGVSERLHPATVWNRCTEPQPDIMQSSGNPAEEKEDIEIGKCRSQRHQGHYKKSSKVNYPGLIGAHRDCK